MSAGMRRAAIIGGAILVVALILGGGWLFLTRRSFPQTRGTVELAGLEAPVEIYRDEYGVPHIYAQTSHDLFMAQGYVHAQDRYWQMEFWRRIGAGRLSEYFGEATLGTDIYLRTVGFARVAEQEYAQAEPVIKAALEAYAEGVNAYTQTRSPAELGIEFQLLALQGIDVTVAPWTPVNTLTWAKVMSQDLGGNMDDELYSVELIRRVGLEKAADFQPAFRSDFPVIVPDEELDYVEGGGQAALPDADTLAYLADLNTTLVGAFDPAQSLAFGSGDGIGSNNWAVSGDLTTTGMPLLANDPHLGIQMPSIWYEVGLHCVEVNAACPYNVRGYSFAGAPGVIIGHNDRIAWGVTNTGPDVQDLYIERVNPSNPNQYEVNGEWVDMDIVYETIDVQGQDEPVVLRVRSTHHGPIITDFGGNAEFSSFGVNVTPQLPTDMRDGLELTALSLRWTALEPNTTFQSVLMIDRAQNWDDFRAALARWDVPAQNFVYADVEGNIGYQMPGIIPIREQGDGSLPVPGWVDVYEWTGYIPFDELPRAFNPEQGYIATANQAVVHDEIYPYLLGTEWDHGYRAARIVDMLEAQRGSISADIVAEIQGDNLNGSALEILPYLKDLSFEDPTVSQQRDWLLAWDAQMDMDSGEAALYAHFWVRLVDGLFNDELPSTLYTGGGSRQQDALYHLLGDPRNAWWDDVDTPDVTEMRDDILRSAFEKGYADAIEMLGDNPANWRWGDVHTADFRNGTLGESGIGLIEGIFNRGPVAASGGNGQVNATSWSVKEPFAVSSVPSMRQIIDLGDLSNSLMMHTTGQSGHPYHRHYADFIDPWRLIEYHPTNWTLADVQASSRGVLRLEPGD